MYTFKLQVRVGDTVLGIVNVEADAVDAARYLVESNLVIEQAETVPVCFLSAAMLKAKT